MATKVRIGPNESRVVQVLSPTELVATYEGGGLPGQPEDVVVETSTGSATLPNGYTPTRPLPTITRIEPQVGPGGTQVRITGTGFEA